MTSGKADGAGGAGGLVQESVESAGLGGNGGARGGKEGGGGFMVFSLSSSYHHLARYHIILSLDYGDLQLADLLRAECGALFTCGLLCYRSGSTMWCSIPFHYISFLYIKYH